MLPPKPTLRDAALQHSLTSHGFVVVDGLGAGAATALFEQVWARFAGEPGGFHSSASSTEPGYREGLHHLLVGSFAPLAEALFDDHVPFQSGVLIKWPGAGGRIDPHQDWSFVDESRYRSVSIWCPLTDVTSENGALSVLPASHRRLDTLRPRNGFPEDYRDPVDQVGLSDLVEVELSAGQCVLFDHATVHGSPENDTTYPRTAVAVAFAPATATLFDWWRREDSLVDRYEVSDSQWFRTADITRPPEGLEWVGRDAVEVNPPTTHELLGNGGRAASSSNRDDRAPVPAQEPA